MSALSNASARVYTSLVNPTVSEPGAEIGNFWVNTVTDQAFVCADDTFGAQVWRNSSFNPITQFNALVGGAGNTLTSIPPTATTGVPLVSNGAGSNPTFSTASVAGGGTGATTLTGVLSGNGTVPITASPITIHNVLVGNVSNSITSISPSTSGFVLTSNGVGSDPTFQANSAANAILTITGNTGGPQSPTANNFNIVGTGSITVAGSAATETVQLTGLTAFNVLVGAGTATITNVAPSATAGIPLVSTGGASNPSFTTAVVAGGGTGAVTFTAFAVVCGGTTATSPLQTTATAGTAGQVLISGGAAALPSYRNTPAFMAFLAGNSTAMTTGTTYTFSTASLPGSPGITVAYDTTSSFSAATGAFTAPVTGRYHFCCTFQGSSIVAGNTDFQMFINPSTANRLFQTRINLGSFRTVGNIASVTVTCETDLTAADTVTAEFLVNTGGSGVIINGSGVQQLTWFEGHLITTQ